MASSSQIVGGFSDWGPPGGGSTTYAAEPRPARSTTRRRSGEHQQQAALARTIEGEIIPRLMLADKFQDAQPLRPNAGTLPAPYEVVEFAQVIMTEPVDVGLAYLEAMRFRGVSLETLFLEAISPAARRLGDLWKADLCDFTEVTVGLSRLQQLLCELSPAFENEEEHRSSTRRALLVACPGEQHSLGLYMVQEFFRRAGWHLHSVVPRTHDELKAIVQAQRFDIVGFSLSCEVFMDQLKSAIQITRKHSKNRAVGIMAGGRLFNEHPEMVARVGADATAVDGRQAVLRLPAVLGLKASNC